MGVADSNRLRISRRRDLRSAGPRAKAPVTAARVVVTGVLLGVGILVAATILAGALSELSGYLFDRFPIVACSVLLVAAASAGVAWEWKRRS